MTWFEKLTGFQEESPEQVHANLEIKGNRLTSKANGRSFIWGRLEIPSLAELRQQLDAVQLPEGGPSLQELVADVQQLHADPDNAWALFQAASQFNLLEMVNPAVTPEQGIGIYDYDHTQGPACAIACGAGTIYRNYFVPLGQQTGQRAARQVDCLHDLGVALGNDQEQLWKMQNGYALPAAAGLEKVAAHLNLLNEAQRDELRKLIRIGLQWDTQVTLAGCQHLVSQAYCSALPVAYSRIEGDHWGPFAQLVLEAAYEATFCAAALNLARSGNNKLFLTLVGGGAFGNRTSWIFAALRRALSRYAHVPLAVYIVSYGQSQPAVRAFAEEWNALTLK